MNIQIQSAIESLHNMDRSVMAVECLTQQAAFDDQTQALLTVLAKDLRESFDRMFQKQIQNLPKE